MSPQSFKKFIFLHLFLKMWKWQIFDNVCLQRNQIASQWSILMNQKQKQSMRKMRRILTGIIHQFKTASVWVECFLAALVVSPRERWTDRTLSTVRIFHYYQMIRKSTSALAVKQVIENFDQRKWSRDLRTQALEKARSYWNFVWFDFKSFWIKNFYLF